MFRAQRMVIRLVLASIAILTGGQFAAAQINETLADEILEMYDKSQKAHKPLLENKKDQAVISKVMQVDRENTAKFKDIIKRYGWPGRNVVGPEAAEAAFRLVCALKDDRAFQKECLKLMEQSAAQGNTEYGQVAFVMDYLLVMYEKKKQKYGTMVNLAASQKKGEIVLYPIEDEKNVDQRRKEWGLMPLDDFKKQMGEQLKIGKDKEKDK